MKPTKQEADGNVCRRDFMFDFFVLSSFVVDKTQDILHLRSLPAALASLFVRAVGEE